MYVSFLFFVLQVNIFFIKFRVKEATNNKLSIWKRPMIINGLGIVSKVELAFFLMFIALVVWSFATYLHVGFATITPMSAAENGETVYVLIDIFFFTSNQNELWLVVTLWLVKLHDICCEYSWQSKLDSVALRLGLIGNICLAFLFFPVTHGSSILPLFGLTSEASVKYHIWLVHMVMALFSAHGVCYIIYWIVTKQTSEVLVDILFYKS